MFVWKDEKEAKCGLYLKNIPKSCIALASSYWWILPKLTWTLEAADLLGGCIRRVLLLFLRGRDRGRQEVYAFETWTTKKLSFNFSD